MRFIDEYRNEAAARHYSDKIRDVTTRSWTIMEICGGQTHTIVKYGLEELLPKEITLVHGPGCPVCVTPLEIIEAEISPGTPAVGRSVRSLKLPEGSLVGGIVRSGKVVPAVGEAVLEVGDRVIVFAPTVAEADVRKVLAG